MAVVLLLLSGFLLTLIIINEKIVMANMMVAVIINKISLLLCSLGLMVGWIGWILLSSMLFSISIIIHDATGSNVGGNKIS